MANHQFDRLFTIEEANLLVPRLENLMRKLQAEAAILRARIGDLVAADSSLVGLEFPDLVRRRPELSDNAARMGELTEEIEELGCLLKDIDQGLVDFPFERDDEVAFLCWQYGEPAVVAWHPLDQGFAARQPLPGALKSYLN